MPLLRYNITQPQVTTADLIAVEFHAMKPLPELLQCQELQPLPLILLPEKEESVHLSNHNNQHDIIRLLELDVAEATKQQASGSVAALLAEPYQHTSLEGNPNNFIMGRDMKLREAQGMSSTTNNNRLEANPTHRPETSYLDLTQNNSTMSFQYPPFQSSQVSLMLHKILLS